MQDEKGLQAGYWFSINTDSGLHQVSWRNQIWGKSSFDSVVGVFDGSKNGGWMAIYVNGVLADELSRIGTKINYPSYGTQQVYLGGRANEIQMFAGVLANAKILSGAYIPGNSLGAGEGEQPVLAALEKQDVNRDGSITPLDALQVINFLSRNGSVVLAPTAARLADSDRNDVANEQQWQWLDVSCDGVISPMDALQVINRLKSSRIDVPATDVAIQQLADSTFLRYDEWSVVNRKMSDALASRK